MVAIIPKQKRAKTLFPWLKPCAPGPGVVPAEIAPVAAPACLGKWQRRWLASAFGLTQAIALGLGLWLPSALHKTAAEESAMPVSAEQRLWDALGSAELDKTMLLAQQQQADQQLKLAQQEALQAQQLRIDAEEKAQRLVAGAKDRAGDMTAVAIRRSNRIKLEATYVGAEQVIQADEGDEVTLKFTARVQCAPGSFGMTAIATPVDARIATREVRNLGRCFPSAEAAAGNAIGEVGEWGVAFFNIDSR